MYTDTLTLINRRIKLCTYYQSITILYNLCKYIMSIVCDVGFLAMIHYINKLVEGKRTLNILCIMFTPLAFRDRLNN